MAEIGDRDGGSASVWVLSCAALLLVVAVVVVLRTGAVLARHRAENAADESALAGAAQIGISDQICAAAAEVADAKGAHLSKCTPTLAATGRSGTVDVVVGIQLTLPVVGAQTITASARAGRDPPG